jgi:hypothetical protein
MGEESATGWIMHDGSGGPRVSHKQTIELAYDLDETRGKLTSAGLEKITPGYPGFFWRWKRVRVGWFRFVKQRVCYNPAYAPIKAYRLQKPRSTEVDRLADIAADPYAPPPVINPEGPLYLPKRVKA